MISSESQKCYLYTGCFALSANSLLCIHPIQLKISTICFPYPFADEVQTMSSHSTFSVAVYSLFEFVRIGELLSN